nr:hypothetical protein [Mucilaginibacter sp. L294]
MTLDGRRELNNIAQPHHYADQLKIRLRQQPLKNSTPVIVQGYYESRAMEGEDDSCDISATIQKAGNKYYYKLEAAGKTYRGILKVMKGDHNQERHIIFSGIKWALNEGDVSHLKDDESPEPLPLPIGIAGVLSNNEIKIQNSGNAMNHYIQLDACDMKYIRMVKQTK